MSILGYSSAYFLPQYWGSTPLYGEKLIPLIDYILSTDYVQSEKLAEAFYTIENKYKNTGELPIENIKAIIEESGYKYVLDLLGTDEKSIRLLIYLLVLIHQLKGTGLGIEVVLNLLKRDSNSMKLNTVGFPKDENGVYSEFSTEDFIYYDGFSTETKPFEIFITFKLNMLGVDQCLFSAGNQRMYVGINPAGKVVLKIKSFGSNTWDIVDTVSSGSLALTSVYLLKLAYDGNGYTLKIASVPNFSTSVSKARFVDYIAPISNPAYTGLQSDRLYIGVNYDNGSVSEPFRGQVDLNPFAANVENVEITEWFNEPIIEPEYEGTFRVKADVDLGVASSDFFAKFAEFVRKYVYPTLRAFEAELKLQSNLTFIPYACQNIQYTASGDVSQQIQDYIDSLNSD